MTPVCALIVNALVGSPDNENSTTALLVASLSVAKIVITDAGAMVTSVIFKSIIPEGASCGLLSFTSMTVTLTKAFPVSLSSDAVLFATT